MKPIQLTFSVIKLEEKKTKLNEWMNNQQQQRTREREISVKMKVKQAVDSGQTTVGRYEYKHKTPVSRW